MHPSRRNPPRQYHFAGGRCNADKTETFEWTRDAVRPLASCTAAAARHRGCSPRGSIYDGRDLSRASTATLVCCACAGATDPDNSQRAAEPAISHRHEGFGLRRRIPPVPLNRGVADATLYDNPLYNTATSPARGFALVTEERMRASVPKRHLLG